MTLQVENLRQTYDRTYDNLMTNRKILFVIWPHCIKLEHSCNCTKQENTNSHKQSAGWFTILQMYRQFWYLDNACVCLCVCVFINKIWITWPQICRCVMFMQQKVKSFPSHIDPLGSTDLPQPVTSSHCKTTNMELMHSVVFFHCSHCTYPEMEGQVKLTWMSIDGKKGK